MVDTVIGNERMEIGRTKGQPEANPGRGNRLYKRIGDGFGDGYGDGRSI